MAFVKNLFDKNFIEYASYVIRDRAIPDLEDGLKPVQRRIMHTLFTIDDGRMHKVASVVGDCMKFHPHGDASIGGALVVLANKGIFIARQGNFGNMYTGDEASATRYIECCVHPIAKKFLYNPDITEYIPSYDGRNKEPVVFRAKIPVVLVGGAEGIAVGMSTKILPYNFKEVIDAEIKALRGEDFEIFPDVPTGGLIDVSNYNDGNGKIITRAKFDMSDEKRIVITELPVDTTSKDLLDSIDSAYKAGKIKISSVEDFTTDHCNIEIKLPRGVYAKDVEKALYAYTACEKSISCQMLVIKDNMPVAMTATEVIKYYAKKLTVIIKDELEFERASLTEELHARTLERIFIEERIYKKIEMMKTAESVNRAVKEGFVPFKNELVHEVSDDDVDRLLKIPIRRISLFDINKNKDQVAAINARLKEIARRLKHLTDCAVEYLDSVLEEMKNYTALDPKKDPRAVDPKLMERQTTITSFSAVNAKEIVKRDIPLRYDDKGYLGTSVSAGKELIKVTPYDRILIVRKSGIWSVCDVPDKLFVDTGMWFCNYADKDVIGKILFTIIYRDPKTKFCFIKRCRIAGWIMNRDYSFVPDGMEVLHVDSRDKFKFTMRFVKKPRIKISEQEYKASSYEEKGLKANGVRLESREVESVSVEPSDNNGQGTLF
ncbi:DNA topoisomerase IV subunit A [uncultured Treponema sp.]|uniref:DNA topoisomerase IV subunit A n=1 Tax=uncultured Treponema sp. TaxID=162155 RepID=UPI002589CDCA|nr:DNA topoisomerase IV subunit A [uncultured Treponema sp.]